MEGESSRFRLTRETPRMNVDTFTRRVSHSNVNLELLDPEKVLRATNVVLLVIVVIRFSFN